jgi:uncharacterized protein involved in exopolysaccharide biosynthesis
MSEDISPRDSLEHALRYWWVIAMTMIIGGIVGWSIARFSAPVYEARAGYRVTLDEDAVLAEAQKTNPSAELTYELKAPYLTPVALMFYDPEVRSAVEELAQEEELDFPEDGFRSGQLNLDQRRSDWSIIVRHRDSETAAKIANLWVVIADEQLQKAHAQAALAESLKVQMSLITHCFLNSSLTEGNKCAGMSFSDLAEMQAHYQDLDRQYQDAFSASEGVSMLVRFGPGVMAQAPVRPVYYNTGLLTLAGSLLGLILGGVLVQKLPIK